MAHDDDRKPPPTWDDDTTKYDNPVADEPKAPASVHDQDHPTEFPDEVTKYDNPVAHERESAYVEVSETEVKVQDPNAEPSGYTPPTSAEELLERYAIGERYFVGAQLQDAPSISGADLSSANLSQVDFQNASLSTANLNGTNLRQANLCDVNLGGAELIHADLTDANLSKAYLSGADLRWAYISGACLDGATLSGTALDDYTDLLTTRWDTLIISNQEYDREAVGRGEQTLPIGMNIPLSVLIETARLRGEKRDAAETVADYLAANGIDARVESVGGAGTIIRISVRDKQDAHLLLQTGDGVCRLLGLGTGVENMLPAKTGQDLIQEKMDQGFAMVAGELAQSREAVLDALNRIGNEDLKKVVLTGFTAEQMAALKRVAVHGSEFFEQKLDETNRKLVMTTGQKVAQDIYETEVAKPLRTLLSAALRSFNPETNNEDDT